MVKNSFLFNTPFLYEIKFILFYIIFISLNIPLKCYKFFKAFNTLTNDVIILCEQGIIKYDPETELEFIIESYDIFKEERSIEFVSISQFPLSEGGYILCLIQNYIYLLSKDASESYGYILVPDIEEINSELIPYTNINNKKSFIVAYISDLSLNLLMYEINFTYFNETQLIYKKAQEILYEDSAIINNIISCNVMKLLNETKFLNCFLCNTHYSIISLTFDQENNFTLLNLFSNKTESSILILSQILSPDQRKSLVCYIDGQNNFKCFIYSLENQNEEWNKSEILIDNCVKYHYTRGLRYNNDKKEFLLFCYQKNFKDISSIKLDDNFNIKYIDNEKCTLYFKIENYYSIYSSSLFYDKYNEQYYFILYGDGDNDFNKFRISEIQDKCNNISYKSHLDESKISFLTSSSIPIYSSKLSLISPTIRIPSTIPNIASIETFANIPSIPSISYISNNSSLYIYNTSIFTSIIIKEKKILSIDINDIIFYNNGDILKGKINKTKEEIENNINDIIEQIEIGKKYEINGDDYNILISPVEDIDTFQSTHVEFSICEQILRKVHNIPTDEILTIIQIDFDKMNEKAITNQVEYEIYNEKKEKLDLSYCKDVKIKVIYSIKEDSAINKTMVSYFSEIGVDIFDREDSFFNDICYSYSISGSDIILKDRVLDIYQNFSLCDNNCEYEQIDIESMSITCSCHVKTELNLEVSKPVFGKIVEDTFKNSNFGVIKCYSLVFDFKIKQNNIGFWIFLIFVLIHISCFIYYFIYGMKSLRIFVYKEMYKFKFFINLSAETSFPNKRNIKKKTLNSNGLHLDKIDNKVYEINKLEEVSSSSSKYKIFNENEYKKDNLLIRKNKIKKYKTEKKSIKINNPIMIFKYNYYNIDKSKNNSYLSLIKKNKTTVENKINKEIYSNDKKYKNTESNENDKKCPGYYYFIQINANNDKNNEPPESKYILNNYDYENAIKYDKRDFWRIFFIFLLSKENILNTFFFYSPLEIQSLRLSIFIFSYSCDFALNALFYLNKNISDKYHYEGENLYWFTLVNNLTISITSTLFSFILIKTLSLLINSKDSMENLFRKEEKIMRKNKNYRVSRQNKRIILENMVKIFKTLKIKIICYIIIEFIILLFFFYYITAFCEVYKSTQMSLISDSFVSFLLSIPFELLISFFLTSLYMISIKYRFEKLYNIVLFFYELG